MFRRKFTCCFTGHRPQSLPCGTDERHPDCIKTKKLLREMIVYLINEKNITHFISGMALGVDMWAAEMVIELKIEYPHITLEAAVPCVTQCAKWSETSKERYSRLFHMCKKTTLIQKNYTSDCMMKRNKYMVKKSDFVIAVWTGKASGTANTIAYARLKDKPVYCINPNNLSVTVL